MTTFLDTLTRDLNRTVTTNGDATNKSSLNVLVDYFALAGAMRDNIPEANNLFRRAYAADPQTAVRTLFYLRDIRGGQGERELFRQGLQNLSATHQEAVLEHIPFYGRWDDLFFHGVTPQVTAFISAQLRKDRLAYLADEPVSLLAKWLPSENASSPKTVGRARQLIRELGMTTPDYRRMLTALRARIGLIEHDISENKWGEIDFAAVPSQAHKKLARAFGRHDQERYAAYLSAMEKGDAKINAATLYPHQVFDMVSPYWGDFREDATANALWSALPDYTRGKDALVMADVSGSMQGRPISVSVSLALYFAERNKSAFQGHFLTFSKNPQLVKVLGNTLAQRMECINSADWGQNTDLSKAFRAILQAAVGAQTPPPAVLYVISDMQFDQATSGGPYGYSQRHPQDGVFETARREFAQQGFNLPHVVFWNVHASSSQVPATMLDGQVSLVSGLSPSIFAQAVEGKTPLELMSSVVNGERYQRIVL